MNQNKYYNFIKNRLLGISPYFVTSIFISVFYIGFSNTSHALQCGNSNGNFLPCDGSQNQFAGSFFALSGFGGFGGGNCSTTKTPVIYIHGNGDHAINFDAQPALAPQGYPLPTQSVYDELKANGYNDCELFGITYLSSTEQSNAQSNYHEPAKQAIIDDFITQVLNYTGSNKVDIISHSMGTSMALSSLKRFNRWDKVRKFINISGGVRGLNSCYSVGYSNPFALTCGSQNIYNSYTFGFYPDSFWYGNNDWTGSSGSRSMRRAPYYNANVDFYTITAENQDQVLCSTAYNFSSCHLGSLFNNYSNVKAQLDVGAGTSALAYDWDWEDGFPTNIAGGDLDGVGHFGSRINTGVIIKNMLLTNCSGTACASNYNGPVN